AAGRANGVDVALYHVQHARATLRRHQPRGSEAVDVDRLVAEAVGDLLAANDEELVVETVESVERLDAGEHVVVGEHEKLVSVRPVPLRHVVRRRVAVAIQRVGVGVSLVPANPSLSAARKRLAQSSRGEEAECGGGGQTEGGN